MIIPTNDLRGYAEINFWVRYFNLETSLDSLLSEVEDVLEFVAVQNIHN